MKDNIRAIYNLVNRTSLVLSLIFAVSGISLLAYVKATQSFMFGANDLGIIGIALYSLVLASLISSGIAFIIKRVCVYKSQSIDIRSYPMLILLDLISLSFFIEPDDENIYTKSYAKVADSDRVDKNTSEE